MPTQVLLFSKSVPNAGCALGPSPAELGQLSETANIAVKQLGPGWKITSAVTNLTHFQMGNLPAMGLMLTVIAAKE